ADDSAALSAHARARHAVGLEVLPCRRRLDALDLFGAHDLREIARRADRAKKAERPIALRHELMRDERPDVDDVVRLYLVQLVAQNRVALALADDDVVLVLVLFEA